MTDAPNRVYVRWGKAGDTRVSYMEERFMPPDNGAEYVRADLHAAALDEIARLREALVDQNDLLRSAMQIAKREGVEGELASTNWDAFYNRVAVSLKRHHQTVNEARAALAPAAEAAPTGERA
jgi:hypothetical protein